MAITVTFENHELALLRRHIQYLIEEEEAELERLTNSSSIEKQKQQEARTRFAERSRRTLYKLRKLHCKLDPKAHES